DGASFVTETGDEIALGFTPDAADGQSVLLGVRPEHLSLSLGGLETIVNVTEPTGHETMVFLRYGSGELVAVLSERHDFEPGQVVTIAPRPGKLHLFDAESGRTLRQD
ncbi:ABC transporter ATP-binding protein, partial [Pseudomonas sp. BGM005]|nr:ABC transporter ATP-binding protein [Pseudomonas sp. BG5]